MSTETKCPFCGATPHRGATKAVSCQLHGEPIQRYAYWCPHGCARIERVNAEQALAAWNNRPTSTPADADGLVEAAGGALQWMEQLADRFESEWPNTSKHCHIHVGTLRAVLQAAKL